MYNSFYLTLTISPIIQILTFILLSFIPLVGHAIVPAIKAELQWAICEPSATELAKKLRAEVSGASSFSVSYLDSPNLSLQKNGISLHLEHKKRKEKIKAESKLKIDVPSLEPINLEWLYSNGGKCELDYYGEDHRLRCSIPSAISGKGKLLSKNQQALLSATRTNFSLPQLRLWGPYTGHKLKVDWANSLLPENPNQKNSLEEVSFKGSSQALTSLIELSVRLDSESAESTYQSISDILRKAGVHLCDSQKGRFERILDSAPPESTPTQ